MPDDDLYAPIDFDIAPHIALPNIPLWDDIDLVRQALGQPPASLWRYVIGDVTLVVNSSLLSVRITDPSPFEMEGQLALLYLGRGALGYVTPRRTRFMTADAAIMLRAIVDETIAERRNLIPKGDPFAGKPRCENCGVILGEFPGDTAELCQQCLVIGPKRWLNRDSAQKRRGEV